ncbi:hypothetical protein [Streptomyces sp. NPDC093111]|uniref:hypothetical protein n=1 Tax=Streptomyces sp. NPDC093111 TaxID=3154978 RepID=UPI00343DEBA6
MRRGTPAALVLLAALAAAGCAKGAEPKQPELPAALCGVPVAADVLRPVLVPGGTVATSGVDGRCGVEVDGRQVLSLQSATQPPTRDYRATWDWQMPHGTPVPIGDEGRAVDTLVGAAQKCAVGGRQQVFVASVERFSTKGGDPAARKAALTRLMGAWFPAARKAAGCAP